MRKFLLTALGALALATTALGLTTPPQAHAEVFVVCSFAMGGDGAEGVVGGHTSCPFAANVRQIVYSTGGQMNFPAYSPVTGQRYEMSCMPGYPASFNDGAVRTVIKCWGGDDAEVVLWYR